MHVGRPLLGGRVNKQGEAWLDPPDDVKQMGSRVRCHRCVGFGVAGVEMLFKFHLNTF